MTRLQWEQVALSFRARARNLTVGAKITHFTLSDLSPCGRSSRPFGMTNQKIITVLPTLTSSFTRAASQLAKRMQPWLAARPITPRSGLRLVRARTSRSSQVSAYHHCCCRKLHEGRTSRLFRRSRWHFQYIDWQVAASRLTNRSSQPLLGE
jgi:hypothetical protein